VHRELRGSLEAITSGVQVWVRRRRPLNPSEDNAMYDYMFFMTDMDILQYFLAVQQVYRLDM